MKAEFDLTKMVEEIAMQAEENQEEFIFETIRPYCENILQIKINKEELKQILLKGAQKTSWIPVSERLPKSRMYCLITVEITPYGCSSNYEVHTAWFDGRFFIDKTDIDHIVAKRSVIAWMPRPEPYNFTKS